MNDRIYQAKYGLLEGLYEEYEVGTNQLAAMLDAVMRRRAQRGLQAKLEEIRKYEAELGIKPEVSPVQPPPDFSSKKPTDPLPTTIQTNRKDVLSLSRIRKILSKCDEFDSNESLLALFSYPELSPYKNRIPQVNNKNSRILQTVALLKDSKLADNRNGLLLLIEILRDSKDERLLLHGELENLITTLT